ncbi:hypothetical protein HY250_03910 [Candidatus Azambacteria bacterium]|nr:hypothetical protein [Candidatus Azambacteria bacterium]
MKFIFSQFVAAENSVRPRKNTAEGGCGGNSAVFLQKIEAKPAALLVESRTQQKSFLFLLEENIARAQNQKCRENFFAGWRVVASGGGLASLAWFRSGISDKMSSSQTVKTHQNLTFGNLPDRFGRAKRGKVWKHWLAAHSAARQAQVRNPLRF